MAEVPRDYLFKYSEISTKSDLDRLRLVFIEIPDERLMHKLEMDRGNGRDDYPVRVIWNTILAGIVFGHETIASLLRELKRNKELRYLCGYDPFKPAEKAVPESYVISRFLKNLLEHSSYIEEMFDILVEKVNKLLKRFGEKLAGDSKAIHSFGNPTKKSSDDRRRDADADYGKKEYKGTRKDGTIWKTVKRWFGYKLHVIVDSFYELPIAFEVTKASSSEQKPMEGLLKKTEERHAEIINKTDAIAYDRGYDGEVFHRVIYEDLGMKPVIDIRNMWKESDGVIEINGEQIETRVLYEDKSDNIVYDYEGRIYCVCPKTGKAHEMLFYGFESTRETLKYRCPAAAYGYDCPGRSECGTTQSEYGRIVRIPVRKNLRVFSPIPRGTYKWKREYNRRSAVERLFSRLDVSFGFEHHTIRGLKKMKVRAGLALIVMLSMAVGHIKEKRMDKLRSLVKT